MEGRLVDLDLGRVDLVGRLDLGRLVDLDIEGRLVDFDFLPPGVQITPVPRFADAATLVLHPLGHLEVPFGARQRRPVVDLPDNTTQRFGQPVRLIFLLNIQVTPAVIVAGTVLLQPLGQVKIPGAALHLLEIPFDKRTEIIPTGHEPLLGLFVLVTFVFDGLLQITPTPRLTEAFVVTVQLFGQRAVPFGALQRPPDNRIQRLGQPVDNEIFLLRSQVTPRLEVALEVSLHPLGHVRVPLGALHLLEIPFVATSVVHPRGQAPLLGLLVVGLLVAVGLLDVFLVAFDGLLQITPTPRLAEAGVLTVQLLGQRAVPLGALQRPLDRRTHSLGQPVVEEIFLLRLQVTPRLEVALEVVAHPLGHVRVPLGALHLLEIPFEAKSVVHPRGQESMLGFFVVLLFDLVGFLVNLQGTDKGTPLITTVHMEVVGDFFLGHVTSTQRPLRLPKQRESLLPLPDIEENTQVTPLVDVDARNCTQDDGHVLIPLEARQRP